MKYIYYSTLILVFILNLFSCKKDKNEGIPNTYVDIYLYTNDPEFNNLTAIGGWVYLTGGSRGLVVTRTTMSDFAAFERHCPYNPGDPCGKVEVDTSTAITLTDPCCGSNFLLNDGSVVNGPSTSPLRRYQTNFDGSVLHIYN